MKSETTVQATQPHIGKNIVPSTRLVTINLEYCTIQDKLSNVI